MAVPVKLDYCVIHVSDWERSNQFYTQVMGAELVARAAAFAYRFGDKQLNVHGRGVKPAEVARLPVQPAIPIFASNGWGRSKTRSPISKSTALPSNAGRCSASAPRGRADPSISAIPTVR
jgi:catechol 2,3-dioxygenase-like lactoylglutathione lyase family enzyme